jgi:hypothetical protein
MRFSLWAAAAWLASESNLLGRVAASPLSDQNLEERNNKPAPKFFIISMVGEDDGVWAMTDQMSRPLIPEVAGLISLS